MTASIEDAPDWITTVVKRYASGVNHVVTVPRNSLKSLVSFGVPFTGVQAPVGARCGTRMGSYLGHDLVMMEPGTKVSCDFCRRLTGIEVQTAETYAPVHT